MRRFWSDRKGNVAVLFAIAIVPVIGMMGAAVDYSLANSYRTDIQKSLDATALALSKILPMDDEEALHAIGMQYFTASLGNNDLKNLTLEIFPEQGKVRLQASGDYTPKIANIFGATEFKIGTSAEAVWSMGKVEVALVLDNSLSMQSPNPQRIIQLKAAAHSLLGILQNAAKQEGDAKVSIVPFDANVRVVPKSSINATWITNNENWIRWDEWNAENGSCNPSGGGRDTKSECEAYEYCSKSQYTRKSTCQNNNGTWKTGAWTPANRASNWNGCVQDRDKAANLDNPLINYDINDVAPTSNETKFPAWQCYNSDTALPTVMPLNYNWGAADSTDTSTLHGKINSLTPSGYTNATIGLAWGFHALSPTPRMEEGVAYGTENYTKIIILLSDGDNTKNRWVTCNPTSPCPSATATALNARTAAVCQSIKSAGIEIYTVRLIDGNADLLRNCASSPSKYYEVSAASQLAGVFNAIGSQIASLHLAK